MGQRFLESAWRLPVGDALYCVCVMLYIYVNVYGGCTETPKHAELHVLDWYSPVYASDASLPELDKLVAVQSEALPGGGVRGYVNTRSTLWFRKIPCGRNSEGRRIEM